MTNNTAERSPGSTLTTTTGVGPLGTGVHLLRSTPRDGGQKVADIWLTFLFLPLVPLGRLVLAGEGPAREPRARTAAAPARALATLLSFWVGAAAAFVPAGVAVRYFIGNQLAALTLMFCTLVSVVGALAWLDSTRGRIPLRALRALAGMGPDTRTPMARLGPRRETTARQEGRCPRL